MNNYEKRLFSFSVALGAAFVHLARAVAKSPLGLTPLIARSALVYGATAYLLTRAAFAIADFFTRPRAVIESDVDRGYYPMHRPRSVVVIERAPDPIIINPNPSRVAYIPSGGAVVAPRLAPVWSHEANVAARRERPSTAYIPSGGAVVMPTAVTPRREGPSRAYIPSGGLARGPESLSRGTVNPSQIGQNFVPGAAGVKVVKRRVG